MPALYVSVNGLIYVALKWLSEQPLQVSRAQLIEVYIAQLSHLIRPR